MIKRKKERKKKYSFDYNIKIKSTFTGKSGDDLNEKRRF